MTEHDSNVMAAGQIVLEALQSQLKFHQERVATLTEAIEFHQAEMEKVKQEITGGQDNEPIS